MNIDNNKKKKNNNLNKKKNNSDFTLLKHNNQVKKENNKHIDLLLYNDYEINRLKYKDALVNDKRTYIEYYLSLLRSNNLLIIM